MSFSTLKFGFLSFGHQGFLFLPKRDGTTSSVRSLNLFKTSPLENIVHLATNTGRLLKAGSVFTFQTGSSQTVMLLKTGLPLMSKWQTYFFIWDSGWFEIFIIRENDLTHISCIHEVSKSEGPSWLGGPHTCTSKFGKNEAAFGRADMDNGSSPACKCLGRSPRSQFPSRPFAKEW